jgi:hypothetical protein
MSNPEQAANLKPLDQAVKDAELMLALINVGTKDRPRRLTRIALTIERIKAWRDVAAPNSDESRGGSTSYDPENRQEDARVARAALRDERDLALHLGIVADIVHRYTTTITENKRPSDDALPGCASCARKRKKGGLEIDGHFNPVADRYKAKQLCMWCGEHLVASGELPPLDVVDVYHRRGAQAAGRELAKRARKLDKSAVA